MMPNKVLITGASGFIGSFLVEEALKQGFEVYAGIRKSSSKQFLQDKRINFIELDFSSGEKLSSQFLQFRQDQGDFSYIVHNAGLTQAEKKEDFLRVNCTYTQNLVTALKASEMPLKKFVLISSLAIYGPGDAQTFRPIDLSDPQKPLSEYAKSKLCADNYVKTHNFFPYIIVNPTAVYGPRDKDFLEFVKLVQLGLEPYIGRYKQMLSFIYVKDLARAVIGLLESTCINRSFIVSDTNGYEKEQLGIEVKRFLKKKTLKITIPALPIRGAVGIFQKAQEFMKGTTPFLNREKLAEISSPNWLCNGDTLWHELSSSPQYNLEKGMEETLTWYRENGWLK
jgi:UDP-glucose 4-epimerase